MTREVSEQKISEVYEICKAYLSDPNNKNTSWTHISKKVLNRSREYISTVLNAEQKQQLWVDALEVRRKFYASKLSKVDEAVLTSAASGDIPAAKLAYQRFEAWAPAEKQVHEGGDKPIEVTHGITPAIRKKLDEIYEQD